MEEWSLYGNEPPLAPPWKEGNKRSNETSLRACLAGALIPSLMSFQVKSRKEKGKMGIQIPDWAKVQHDEIVYDPDLVIQYRFDGLDGLYKLGEKSFESIIIQPICYRTRYSERFGRKPQTWLDLAFVDEQSKVAVMALNKQSANIMMDFLAGLLHEGIAPHAIKVVLQSQRLHVHVIDEDQNAVDDFYHAVLPDEYEFVSKERFDIVAKLKAQNFRFVTLGEVWNG